MKIWCVINISKLRHAEPHDHAPVGHMVLDAGFPRCFYRDREIAEKELLRLQQRHNTGEFILFESVAKAVPSLVVQTIHVENIESERKSPRI